MARRHKYEHLGGSPALYPYAARRGLRARRRAGAVILVVLGVVLLAAAALLYVRQTWYNGGQPAPPAPVSAAGHATPETAGNAAVTIRYATVDALAAETAGTPQSGADAPRPSPAPVSAEREILPRLRSLYEENNDLIGWLTVEGAGIDLPVLYVPGNNEYYMRRGFDRMYSTAGSLFLDGRCSVEPATANWLVYGHNMADGSMFADLMCYESEAFWREHPTFRFDTLYQQGEWRVFAAIRTELGADALPYYTFFDAADEDEWQQRVYVLRAQSLYDTKFVPQYGQQLLVLSTCGETRVGTRKRFAVCAARVD